MGKTSIINQYLNGTFSTELKSNTGAANSEKIVPIEVNGGKRELKLDIWDTAGQEIYKAQGMQFYRNANVVIMVFAINNEFSYNEMNEFADTVDTNCPPDCIKVLVGNKCDLEQERKIDYADALDQAKVLNMNKFFETSATRKETIDQVFAWIANELASRGRVFNSRNPSIKL